MFAIPYTRHKLTIKHERVFFRIHPGLGLLLIQAILEKNLFKLNQLAFYVTHYPRLPPLKTNILFVYAFAIILLGQFYGQKHCYLVLFN